MIPAGAHRSEVIAFGPQALAGTTLAISLAMARNYVEAAVSGIGAGKAVACAVHTVKRTRADNCW